MKKVLMFVFLGVLCCSLATAAPFAPTLLKLSASPTIQYDFDGSDIQIPFTVTGNPASAVFLVFTRGKADKVNNTINGYLGWHHVNKVDTCVYFSPARDFGIGQKTITWNGKDQDGGVVPPGEYTYYIWAFDNQSAKMKMSQHLISRVCSTDIIETDADGLPMTNPIYHDKNGNRWVIGSDPEDATLLQTTKVTLAEGWSSMSTNYGAVPAIDPADYSIFYLEVVNTSSNYSAIQKFKYVPGGDAEIQTDFGEAGYGGMFSGASGYQPGVTTDGTYLYTGDQHLTDKNEPDADFYIVDFEGNIIDTIDLTKWWSNPDEYALNGQMNGGPNGQAMRNGKIFLNCHCSCIKQMVDPVRYLDSGESDDFYVWSNRNGDYVLDHNFEDTANLKWVCNDYNVGPYTYNLDADGNLFSACPAYDVGAVSFGLMAPDGTGLGYFSFSGETAGWKKGNLFLDGNTPYDGMYVDNDQTGGPHYQWVAANRSPGLFFIGQDSITGIITNAVGVSETNPEAFTVAQNTPNPFNPTTTIGFSLVKDGDVSIDVFNVAGQKVDTLASGRMTAGSHSVVWDASNFSAGVYFYTVKSGGHTKTMKMTLIK